MKSIRINFSSVRIPSDVKVMLKFEDIRGQGYMFQNINMYGLNVYIIYTYILCVYNPVFE